MAADNIQTTDLSQTHLRTTHVIAIVLAIITAGLTIVKVYYGLTLEVRDLKTKTQEIPTKQDLKDLHNELSVELTHAASERVKFYMEHAALTCDPTPKGHKQNCRLVWPAPD